MLTQTFTSSPSKLLGFIDFLGDCALIDDEPQLTDALGRVASYFDADVALCLVDCAGDRPPAVIDFVNHSFPRPWLDHYVRCCCHDDPVLRHTAKFCVPVSWNEVDDCRENSELCDSVRDFGLDGISYAFGNGIKSVIALSSAQRGLLACDGMLRALTPLLHDAFQRVFYRKQCSSEGFRLTIREREILYWSAEGKSIEEISRIIAVSMDTVKFHIKNLYSKLNVENRYHAISKALRTGLI